MKTWIPHLMMALGFKILSSKIRHSRNKNDNIVRTLIWIQHVLGAFSHAPPVGAKHFCSDLTVSHSVQEDIALCLPFFWDICEVRWCQRDASNKLKQQDKCEFFFKKLRINFIPLTAYSYNLFFNTVSFLPFVSEESL